MKTFGIIGLGSIGMRHAENIQKMGHNWVFHDPAKDASMSMERLMADDVDAIIVASPTTEHLEQFKYHLEDCGKPVFMEKPIADEYAAEMKTISMIGYNLVFHSCVKKAKEWLDAGLIGRPLWSNFTLAQWNDRPAYLRDGVILNWSHELHLCRYLLGPATVTASSTRLTDGHDDLTDILLTHESGCRSTVHLDYITKPEHRYFKIIGTLGDLHVDLVERAALIHTGTLEQFFGQDTWNDNYIEEMQAFIDRIDGKPGIGCTGEEGLEVLKICLEVRKQAGL